MIIELLVFCYKGVVGFHMDIKSGLPHKSESFYGGKKLSVRPIDFAREIIAVAVVFLTNKFLIETHPPGAPHEFTPFQPGSLVQTGKW